jgi:hypothetical protein
MELVLRNTFYLLSSHQDFTIGVGDHIQNGILFMYGNNIKTHCRINASVLDIVPTVLAAMDNPIPDYVDGRVIQEAFVRKQKIKKIDIQKAKKGGLTDQEIKKNKKL